MDAGTVNQPLYVCVYVPEFPAQAMIRLRPDLGGSPVVIVAGEPPLEAVCSLNAQATRLGIEKGMTRAELDSFTKFSVLRRSESEERVARAALLEAAGMFTPRVEVQPSTSSSFLMLLDMTGTTRIFGPARHAMHCIAQAFARLRFYVQLAASANLRAAVCVAPVASKTAILIPPGHEREKLSKLPLSALHLTASQAETLALWGLNTLGEFAALPEVDVVVRLGPEGKRLRLLARGEHPHLMVPEAPVFTLQEFLAFDTPIELLDSLLFVLGPILDQLLLRAQNRSYALASVTMTLGLEGGGEHKRSIQPALPVLDRALLLKLLQLDLQMHPPASGIISLLVHAEPGDRSKVQLGLFAPQLPEPLRLDVTLARIAALVGEGHVGRAKLLDTHQPERFTMERFLVPTDPPKKSVSVRHTAAMRRCRPPSVVAVKHQGQRPVSFLLHGKVHIVNEAYGPWRRSGNWWSSEVWSLEEWDVRATTPLGDTLLCLLSHDLLRHHWQMEGLYD